MSSNEYLDMNEDSYKKLHKSKETFNITSTPESIKFDNNNTNNTNHNFKELINNNIAVNNIDYQTIQYISDNPVLNNNYFKMISGNNINNCNEKREGFDNITDATNAIALILSDICDITTYLKESKITDNIIDAISILFNTIIGLLEKIKTSLKAGNDNLTSIETEFQKELDNFTLLSKNNGFDQKVDKLIKDLMSLNDYAGVVIDYNTLKTTVNAKMQAINCPLAFEGTTELDGKLNFLENIIQLFKDTFNTFLKNLSTSIQKNSSIMNGSNQTIVEDPTVGTCIAKMIPQQKWVNIIVSVYNQVIDIYVDGQLSTSSVLKKFPAISTSSVDITPDGGFSGVISRVKFTNSAMTIQQAKSIYYDGPIVVESLFSMIPNWVYWTILVIFIFLSNFLYFYLIIYIFI